MAEQTKALIQQPVPTPTSEGLPASIEFAVLGGVIVALAGVWTQVRANERAQAQQSQRVAQNLEAMASKNDGGMRALERRMELLEAGMVHRDTYIEDSVVFKSHLNTLERKLDQILERQLRQ